MAGLQELTGLGIPFVIPVVGQATAGTPNEWPALQAPFKGRITKVQWIPSAAVTANATNFFTLNIRNRGQGGAGSTLAWSRAYSATNSTAFVGESGTLNATVANRSVAEGDTLTIERIVGGAGLAMPQGTVVIWIAPN